MSTDICLPYKMSTINTVSETNQINVNVYYYYKCLP